MTVDELCNKYIINQLSVNNNIDEEHAKIHFKEDLNRILDEREEKGYKRALEQLPNLFFEARRIT